MTKGNPHRDWVSSTLGQTQHCNVLRTTYRKASKQGLKVIHIGVGYPTHSVKLNTIMCYAQLTTKHSSNDWRMSTSGWVNPSQSNSTPSPDMLKGHRSSNCIFVIVHGRLYCSAHFTVNPALHISRRTSWPWQQSIVVKKRDALDPSSKRVAMRLLVAAWQQKWMASAQLGRKGALTYWL